MNETLRFFEEYEAVIYFMLGLGGIVYIYRFWGAWQELKEAVYGLERESAQQRLNQAAIVLFLLLMIGGTVFALVSFGMPNIPISELVLTPTVDLMAESELEITAESPLVEEGLALATATPLPTVEVIENGCVPDVLMITSPASGDAISGQIEVKGTVDIPNFGFYKFEVARAQEELWLTVQAGRQIVREDVLVENWDTSRLPPGEYVLQLIATDNDGESLPPCRIPVLIGAPEE